MRSGGGTTPVCVGRATKGSGQECFTHHKLHKCNEALADCGRGSLVILFFEAPSGRRVPARNINLLENFLMQSAPVGERSPARHQEDRAGEMAHPGSGQVAKEGRAKQSGPAGCRHAWPVTRGGGPASGAG